MTDAEILILAIVLSILDYRNTLCSGLPHASTNSLQMVQNAAVRILTRIRIFDHSKPHFIDFLLMSDQT